MFSINQQFLPRIKPSFVSSTLVELLRKVYV